MSKLYLVLTILMIWTAVHTATVEEAKKEMDAIIRRFTHYHDELTSMVLEPFNTSLEFGRMLNKTHPVAGPFQEVYDDFWLIASERVDLIGTTFQNLFTEILEVPKHAKEFFGSRLENDVQGILAKCSKIKSSERTIKEKLANFYAGCIKTLDGLLPYLNAKKEPHLPAELYEVDKDIKWFNQVLPNYSRRCYWAEDLHDFHNQTECYDYYRSDLEHILEALQNHTSAFDEDQRENYTIFWQDLYNDCVNDKYPKYKVTLAKEC